MPELRMNCLSRPQCVLLLTAFLCGCGAPAAEPLPATERYGLTYAVTPEPGDGTVLVELTVTQDNDLLREMRFEANPAQLLDITADGQLTVNDQRVRWIPPAAGGVLRWRAVVPSRRNGNGHDAWLATDWGLFRAEDIIPRAATRTLIGASSHTVLLFHLPVGWSAVTEYRGANDEFAVAKSNRRFAQPSGWIVMGELGVRRETIAGTRVAIAAPENQGVRRMDMLALLSWTLPELAGVIDEMPARLTIVSAGSPMWRGGLSAPQSIYMHADRPLISENGTSTLLHEVMHVAMGASATGDYDWIVEGLAEYYSLQLLMRSGSVSARRYERALAQQASWAEDAPSLCGQFSSGPSTALAVTIFSRLDTEIRDKSKNKNSLDDVLREMLRSASPIDLNLLSNIAADTLGQNSDALHIDQLPGCRSIAATGGKPD
jgi:hypothetical protein